ncbi:MAG: OmpA family protein [Bacteroidia bacterium]|nr:OmpA family protein [Bacteroidia bacterium]MDW8158779.1 OmpA family protein [Bacteroidia bacterium]
MNIKFLAYFILIILISKYSPTSFSQKIALSSSVNTTFSEISPHLTPDGQYLYFVRISANQDQDIWQAKRITPTEWKDATPFPSPLNSPLGANSVVGISADGKRLYLQNRYFPNGKMEPGISFSQHIDGKWSFPKAIEIRKFYNQSKFLNLHMASDEKTLLMAFEGKDTFGGLDLYVSFLQADSTFSVPLNLGKILNTSSQETCPYLAPDGLTLYFSSDGHPGQGKGDIFVTRRLDSTWQKWSTPQNLGTIINSPEFDGYFSLAPDNQSAYFCSYSSIQSKQTDIYYAKLPAIFSPNPIIKLKGTILRPQKDTLTFQVWALNAQTAEVVTTSLVSKLESSFEFWLLPDISYLVIGSPYEYFQEPILIPKLNPMQDTIIYLTLEHKKKKSPSKQYFGNILFEYASSKILAKEHNKLKQLLLELQQHPHMEVELEGHTDSLGNSLANYTLAFKRAESIKNWLAKNGIAQHRIKVRSLGAKFPIANNSSEQGRTQNRRVDIFLNIPN